MGGGGSVKRPRTARFDVRQIEGEYAFHVTNLRPREAMHHTAVEVEGYSLGVVVSVALLPSSGSYSKRIS